MPRKKFLRKFKTVELFQDRDTFDQQVCGLPGTEPQPMKAGAFDCPEHCDNEIKYYGDEITFNSTTGELVLSEEDRKGFSLDKYCVSYECDEAWEATAHLCLCPRDEK